MKFLNFFKLLPVLGAMILVSCVPDDVALPSSVSISDYSSISSSEIIATFTPDKNAARFVYAIGLADDKAAFEDGTMEGVLSSTETVTHTFKELEENISYVIYARSYDINDNPGSLATTTVTTILSDFFAEVVYTTAQSAAVKLDGNVESYELTYLITNEAGKKTEFATGELEGTIALIETSEYTVSLFDLIPNTDYVAYAMSSDRSGNKSEVFELPFKTFAIGDCPAVTFEAGKVDNYMGHYSFTPNDKCSKYALLASETSFYDKLIDHKDHGAGDILGYFDFWLAEGLATINSSSATNETELITPNLIPNTPLTFYILTYDLEGNPAGIQKFDAKTPAVDNTLKTAIVTLEISDIREDGIRMNFKANAETLGFLYEVIRDTIYLNQMKELNVTDINDPAIAKVNYDHMIFTGNITNASKEGTEGGRWCYNEWFNETDETNKNSFVYDYYEAGFTPGTDYYAIVCPINANGIDVGFSEYKGFYVEKFTTAGVAPEQ